MSAIASDPKNLYDMVRTGNCGTLRLIAEGVHYVRRFEPRERLILLGGGHIAHVMCRMGAMLDFEVIVVDDRPEFAAPERFPEAAGTICGDFSEVIGTLGVRESDYVCLMTRGHQSDAASLRALLAGESWPGYIGMVGSRRRGRELFALLEREGFDAGRIGTIHAPIGLAINAVSPAEIAVSICGEMIENRRKTYCKHPALEPDAGSEQHPIVLATHDGALPVLRALAEAYGNAADPACDAGETDSAARRENAGGTAFLCVLDTEGSTPVASGACMVTDAAGRIHGTIGGGLGEMSAVEYAKKLIGTGGEMIVRVNMANDAAAAEGMVCGGTMRVLITDLSAARD